MTNYTKCIHCGKKTTRLIREFKETEAIGFMEDGSLDEESAAIVGESIFIQEYVECESCLKQYAFNEK